MDIHGVTRARRLVVVCGLATTLVGAAALTPTWAGVEASAARPVPKCSWTPKTALDHRFGVKLAADKSGPYNGTKDCDYREKHHKLDPKGQDFLTVHYQTFGTFTPPDGSKPVKGIGRCTPGSLTAGCPSGSNSAYLLTVKGNCGTGDVPQTCRKGRKYIQQETLDVQDGADYFTLQLWTLYGPLPVKHETKRLEHLARKLVPLFYSAS